jgi:protein-S-isoprenylcysteine O-methyltransferase Ste14
MWVGLGNFLFRYRNGLGPAVLLLALVVGRPARPFGEPWLDLAFDAAGVLLALLGEGLRILTIGFAYIERGGRNRQVHASSLVQGGVFGVSRNPLYVGNVLICLGMALIVHSWSFYLLAVPFVLLAYGSIVAAEEAFLSGRFGAEYADYCARVNRWWPRWGGLRSATKRMRFDWARVVVKEYNTFFLLVPALAALHLWSAYRIDGPAALPPAGLLTALLGLWVTAYLLVRRLKKSGRVKV